MYTRDYNWLKQRLHVVHLPLVFSSLRPNYIETERQIERMGKGEPDESCLGPIMAGALVELWCVIME
jgi:hypothetical protein